MLTLPRPCSCPRIGLGWEDRRVREVLQHRLSLVTVAPSPRQCRMEAKLVQTFLSLTTHLDSGAVLEGRTWVVG